MFVGNLCQTEDWNDAVNWNANHNAECQKDMWLVNIYPIKEVAFFGFWPILTL